MACFRYIIVNTLHKAETRIIIIIIIIIIIKTHPRCAEINPLNAKLNPICHLLALLGAHPILHVGRIRVNLCI
jgi:hypothetical protein